ncbi:hypothetical protein E0H26_19175 [Micromonospora zingiberis]|uniref:ESX-1 secretion-associated protein n=1 Tax=Micromonospora zingiberis TaxID=2053011 RepID=A0A4R0GF23_9ACTN|nr:hypothetical protein [Micromonospora zingiberis]TCB95586.1 hypothetical protein E0H26_19175 [Micromonospora zingiberis]
MSTPTGEEVVAAFEAIATDVSGWRRSSHLLQTAATNARSFGLTGLHFGYLADGAGVTAKYEEIQDLAVRLLSEGASAMDEIAEVLISVIEDYQYTDAEAASGFTTLREPN